MAPSTDPGKTNKPFVAEIDVSLADTIQSKLKNLGFSISKPQYTLFQARKEGVNCTLYSSGKLVIQGSKAQEFVEFYFEPEIMQSLIFTLKKEIQDTHPRIGIDESGKGDFFGPLCIAGVYAKGDELKKLEDLGVCDSKKITDKNIFILAKKITATCDHHIIKIGPKRYNEMYASIRNLNHLLAWGHVTIIEILSQKTNCIDVIIDQFASEATVLNQLKKKSVNVNLTQRPRAEDDLVVAAASILARHAFLEELDALKRKYNLTFPKGASSKVIEAGISFVQIHGEKALQEVAKLHFKTLDVILRKK